MHISSTVLIYGTYNETHTEHVDGMAYASHIQEGVHGYMGSEIQSAFVCLFSDPPILYWCCLVFLGSNWLHEFPWLQHLSVFLCWRRAHMFPDISQPTNSYNMPQISASKRRTNGSNRGVFSLRKPRFHHPSQETHRSPQVADAHWSCMSGIVYGANSC